MIGIIGSWVAAGREPATLEPVGDSGYDPLVTHKLTALRDVSTETATFRRLADELVTLLAYEATREIRVQAVTVPDPRSARSRGPSWTARHR